MPTRSRYIFNILILFTLFVALPLRQVFAAPSFTVDSTLDEVDDNTSDGICHSVTNHCTLRAAIMQANKMTGPSVTINLPAGTYTLTRPPAGVNSDDNGDLNLTTPAGGNPVISISGAGAGTTIIDANQIDRIFFVDPSRDAFISGLTIRNGFAPMTLKGGGIYNSGTLTVTNSTISGNSTDVNGGGIFNDGTLTVNNSSISNNQGGDGGGISNDGTLAVSNSSISGNQSGNGGNGGGIFSNGTLTVSNSSISGNHAGYGGGIFNNFSGSLMVTNSTISGNSADSGGGIVSSNSLFIVNSTLSLNSANREGGGIYSNGTANLYSTTIVFNGADALLDSFTGSGGGVFNYPGHTFNLINTLIAGNYLQNNGSVNDDCNGTFNSYGGNLFWYVSALCTVNNKSGSPWAYLDSLSTIGPLQNNGGPTFTHALLLGSNAINGADPTLGCIDSGYVQLPTDQRGVARPQSAWCDVGAYEFNDYTAPTVSSIVRTDANPSSAASVGFTVTFSESVTGVDAADFALTTSGVSGAAVSGVSGSGNSYTTTVNTGSGNGTIRLDVIHNGTIKDAALNPLAAGFANGETYTITKSATFTDVPLTYWADNYIERLYNAGITGGCGVGAYCPDTAVTRAQMAVFLLKGMHGSGFTPPDVGGSTGFSDVATSYWAATWIKQLATEGITGGCGAGIYCPDATVTRAQMAVFLLKAKHGSSYSPPSATGVFSDVPVGYWADKWIEQLAAEGVTSGCGAGIYCPDADVTRAQMAVFLVKAFNLP